MQESNVNSNTIEDTNKHKSGKYTIFKKLREEKGLTVRELSKELGYSSHSHINAIENGTREPNINLLTRYHDFFHIPYEILMEEIANKKPSKENKKDKQANQSCKDKK